MIMKCFNHEAVMGSASYRAFSLSVKTRNLVVSYSRGTPFVMIGTEQEVSIA